MQRRPIAASDSASCSILVVSCDGYRDLWTPFFTLFRRYWPDCQMPVYLGTNCAQAGLDRVHVLHAGNEKAWSGRLRVFLDNIESEYVLLLLEDFFLDQTVSNAAVERQIGVLHSLRGVAMRLFPNPCADYIRDGIGVIHARAAFRVSLQAAIWNRARLAELLVDDESCWEFETRGSRRSQSWASGFYCVSRALIHYRHVVERGEWFRGAARLYGARSLGCDFQARPVMGLFKTCKKRPANWARRYFNKLRSRWLCARYPESVSDAG